MYKTIYLSINQESLPGIETRVYDGKLGVHAVVQFDIETQLQIRSDALRGFIEKLEAVEAEINGKAAEHIEQIRFHRHVSVMPEGEDLTANQLKGILQRNGTVMP